MMKAMVPAVETAEIIAPCVLVVDDESSISEEIVDWLTLNGISCRSASCADEAMDILAGNDAITVMLTDINMPGTNGITLSINALASRSDETALEVVVLTAHTTKEFTLDALRARVVDFIPKPAPLAELQAAVDRAHAQATARRLRFQKSTSLIAKLQASIQAFETAPVQSGSAVDGRTRTNFLALISHEVLTALHQIAGFSELLSQNPAALRPEELQEYGQSLTTAGTNLAEHTKMLLQIVESETAARTIRRLPQNLSELLTFLVGSHLAGAQARAQTIRLDCPPDIILHTDGEQLEQVLRHLMTSALRFSAEGWTITVGLRSARDFIRIFVIEAPGDTDVTEFLDRVPADHTHSSAISFRRNGEGIGIGVSMLQATRLGGWLDISAHAGGINVAMLALPLTAPIAGHA
jgi:FixJ family two-component response regulator